MLRGIWALIVFCVATLVLGPLAILFGALSRDSTMPLQISKVWSRVMLRAIQIRPDYQGLQNSTGPSPVIFISNHQSVVDIWALAPRLPNRTLFVAKRELFRLPIIGWAMRVAGFISIDRANLDSAIQSLDAAAEKIRRGRPLILFPEGTRSRNGRLGPFKKGAFHLALNAGVPIVPVTVSGSWGVIRPRTVRVYPGPVSVTFGVPIDPAPFAPDDVAGLSRVVRSAIARRLQPHEVAPDDDVAPDEVAPRAETP